MSMLLLCLLIVLSNCTHSKLKSPDAPPIVQISSEKSKVTCSQNTDIRYIEIRKFQNNGCNLFYTKFNTEKSIASAASEKKYCQDVSNKIIQNLTDSGFVCE